MVEYITSVCGSTSQEYIAERIEIGSDRVRGDLRLAMQHVDRI
jgi:hypothetical protein